MLSQLAGGIQHMAQVRRSIAAGRRAHGNKVHDSIRDRIGERGRKAEAAFLHVVDDDGIEAGLVDRQHALA